MSRRWNSYLTTSTAVSNAAIVPAGTSGAISVYVTDTTDAVLDINGYFAPPASNGLEFYPVTPCRLVDTRIVVPGSLWASGDDCRGCPIFRHTDQFGLRDTGKRGGVFAERDGDTEEHAGDSQHLPGRTAAAQCLDAQCVRSRNGRGEGRRHRVPAGSGGAISVYVTEATDLVIDINGYYAAATSNGLKLYPVTPCRVADTRVSSFPMGLGTPMMSAQSIRSFAIPGESTCGVAPAPAYSLNFTAVPDAPQLGIFATVWPTGSVRCPTCRR